MRPGAVKILSRTFSKNAVGGKACLYNEGDAIQGRRLALGFIRGRLRPGPVYFHIACLGFLIKDQTGRFFVVFL
jgi:hypothetical protein